MRGYPCCAGGGFCVCAGRELWHGEIAAHIRVHAHTCISMHGLAWVGGTVQGMSRVIPGDREVGRKGGEERHSEICLATSVTKQPAALHAACQRIARMSEKPHFHTSPKITEDRVQIPGTVGIFLSFAGQRL